MTGRIPGDYRRDVNDVVREGRWTFFKVFWSLIVPIAVLFLAVGLTWNVLSRPAGVIDRTFNPDSMIHNYEWFKQTYQDVQALDQKIRNAQATVDDFKATAGPRSEWGYGAQTEFGRLSGVLLGLKNQRNDVAAEYNARSKMANRNIFKTGDLPETIPIAGE